MLQPLPYAPSHPVHMCCCFQATMNLHYSGSLFTNIPWCPTIYCIVWSSAVWEWMKCCQIWFIFLNVQWFSCFNTESTWPIRQSICASCVALTDLISDGPNRHRLCDPSPRFSTIAFVFLWTLLKIIFKYSAKAELCCLSSWKGDW